MAEIAYPATSTKTYGRDQPIMEGVNLDNPQSASSW